MTFRRTTPITALDLDPIDLPGPPHPQRAVTLGAPATGVTKQYNAGLNVYNLKASNLRRMRAALAKVAAGTGRCRFAHIGDATTQGVGAGSAALEVTDSWPALLSSLLNSKGYTVDGASWVDKQHRVWPQWVVGGTWNTLGNGVPAQFAGGSSGTLTFTSTHAGTILDLYYLNTGASFTYTLDGGSSTSVTTTGAQSIGTLSLTGLANTTHTLVITPGSNSQILGAFVHSSATVGLQYWNGGMGSSTSTYWYNSNNWFRARSSLQHGLRT
jgi:hypothetical protein